jgi:hypothetical protein
MVGILFLLVTWRDQVTTGYPYIRFHIYFLLSFLVLRKLTNQSLLSNFTPHSYAVIPRYGSPFYCLYYSVFYIPITLATQGRFRSGALSSYISLAVVGSQLHHSYDDDNLSYLVQDSLMYFLLRLHSSVPHFS